MDIRYIMHWIDLAEYHCLIRINDEICPLALSEEMISIAKRG